jgi:parvulin-like peptidyl-prolyl isomerase
MKIRVAHILLEHRFQAEDVLRKLKHPDDFESLARRHSVCPSAKDGGDLGEVDSSQLDEDFFEAAQALKVNEISAVVRTKFGFHLIKKLA